MSDKAQKIGRRWWNAKAIIDGACNPRAICHSIIEGCNEVLNVENGDPKKDAAIRLMAYQLSYVLGVSNGVDDYGTKGENFTADYNKVCEMAEKYDQQQEKERFEARCKRDENDYERECRERVEDEKLLRDQADEAAKRG